MSPPKYSSSADWLRPAEEQEGLKRSVDTIRERIWVIVGAVVVTTFIAIVYVLTAAKSYEATTDVLVTPVSSNDPVVTSLGLLRESSDPTRDVQTASQLIANIDVARRASKQLSPSESPEQLLTDVSAEPVANSNIVAVIATAGSAERAKEIANTFANAAVEEQTDRMNAQIEARLPQLEAINSTDAEAAEVGGVSVAAQIAELQALSSGPNPTMRVQTKATLPTAPSSPQKKVSLIAGIIAGLILGLGGAFALQTLDPRLRREAQLRREFRLPILARVPRASRAESGRPLMPAKASPVIGEAYRTLRATLTRPRQEDGRSPGRVILVTGSSPSEGKTTSAISLASSLALVGKRVLLIEADLRRPVMGKIFDVQPEGSGVVSVLIDRVDLADSLVQTEQYGPNLQLLLAEPSYQGGWITELFSGNRANALLDEARELADYVIIDSPPLNEVVDALPLAGAADDVLLVARLRRSRMDKLHELGELLAENAIEPTGFVLIGVKTVRGGRNHYARQTPGERDRRPGSGRAGATQSGKPINTGK